MIQHIKRHFDFIEMRSTPLKAFTHSFVLQLRPNNVGTVRVGFTVSKKIAKHAVVRNKLRRQMREIVRLNQRLEQLYPAHDLILIAREEALNRSFQQLSQDFDYLLTHVKDISHESEADDKTEKYRR